jgi:serine phosphatase RsbU (regulator of sigma subunit)
MVDTAEGGDGVSVAEQAFDQLLASSHLAAAFELPGLIADSARVLGARDARAYLADLQQLTLLPFVDDARPGLDVSVEPLGIDATVAGRAYQLLEVLTQPEHEGWTRVWLPLVNGTERLGVLSALLDADRAADLDGLFGNRLRRLAALLAEIIVTKTAYSDTTVRLRRQAQMGLAAELQWSLLPPLTFAGGGVTVAGALEPAYEVAGDTLDYAVDAGHACAAVFDGMGHGVRSSQLATVAVAAYRNARRSGLELVAMTTAVHEALLAAFGGAVFTTGTLVDLATETGVLSWINAGHPDPLLLRGNRWVKTLTCPPTPPLGLRLPADIVRAEFTVCQERLEPGDKVLLYTDGVTEARSPDGEFFGEQRLADLLTRNLAAGLPLPETMRRVVRALLEHQQTQLADDATLLLLEWRGDAANLVP